MKVIEISTGTWKLPSIKIIRAMTSLNTCVSKTKKNPEKSQKLSINR